MNKPRMLSEQEKEDLRADLRNMIAYLKEMRMRKSHNALEGELREAVIADLQSGMKRKDVIAKHGVSYQQLQKTDGIGFSHKKGPRTKPVGLDANGEGVPIT